MRNSERYAGYGRLEGPDTRDPFVRALDALSKQPDIVDGFVLQAGNAIKERGISPRLKALLTNGRIWHALGTRRALKAIGNVSAHSIDIHMPEVVEGNNGGKSVRISPSAQKVEGKLLALIGAKHGTPNGVVFHGIAVLDGKEVNRKNIVVVGLHADSGVAFLHPKFKLNAKKNPPVRRAVRREL